MNTNTKVLEMSFDRNTIKHLGISMYSSMPPAIAELIANAYDADAENVMITIDNKSKKIIVEDDGIGMSFDDINNKFLVIGRNRREENKKRTKKNRYVTGKKGLGKLALFGLANKIKIETSVKGSNEKVIFTINWDEIISSEGSNKYKPPNRRQKENINKHYTKVEITGLKRKSPMNIDYLSSKIARLFSFDYSDFKVTLFDNNTGKKIVIDRHIKYSSIKQTVQKIWDISIPMKNIEEGYIRGKIYSYLTPVNSSMCGITLYANGRMVNDSSFFNIQTSSIFFSYVAGWLEIDFIDKNDEDLISTNRQSLNWDNEYIVKIKLEEQLQRVVNNLQKHWREIRIKKHKNIIDKNINVEKWISHIPERYKGAINEIYNISYKDVDKQGNNKKIIKIIHDKIIPEYPQLLWRELHGDIISNKEVRSRYQKKDYHIAVNEAIKSYIKKVADLSGVQDKTNSSLMDTVFGGRKSKQNKSTDKKQKDIPPLIQITDFNDDVEKDIERGQKYYSLGVVAGFRNPISHGPLDEIKKKNLISNQDCLNTLSILSYLYSNLSNRKKPKPITDKP